VVRIFFFLPVYSVLFMNFYVWQAGGMGLLATWSHVMEMNTFVSVILVVRISLSEIANLLS